jgi:hypothetical protein
VARGLPLNDTVEVAMKLVPFTAIKLFVGSWPTGVFEGDSEVSVGTGLFAGLIVKVAATKEGPPGKGLTTVICGNPVLAMYAAGMLTESCSVLTLNATVAHEVEGGAAVTQLPFQKICEVVMNPVPATLSVKDGPPATASSGESDEIMGVGVKVVPFPPQQFIERIASAIKQVSAARRKRISPSLLYAPSEPYNCSLVTAGKAERGTPKRRLQNPHHNLTHELIALQRAARQLGFARNPIGWPPETFGASNDSGLARQGDMLHFDV